MGTHVTKLKRQYFKQRYTSKVTHSEPLLGNISAIKVYQTTYTNI